MYGSSPNHETLLDALADLDPHEGVPPLPVKRVVAGGLRRVWSLLPRPLLPMAYRAMCAAATCLPNTLRIRALGFVARLRADSGGLEQTYPEWLRLYEKVDETVVAGKIAAFPRHPLISVVMPVFDPNPAHLRAAIASVQAQLYSHWELCIADDRSTDPKVAMVLREMAAGEPRIKVIWRQQNGHIAAASNSALSVATGDYVALMDQDDLIPRHALFEVAARIIAHPVPDILYSDEDQIDDGGNRSMPYFKPGWNPDLMLGQNLISHLGVYRRDLLDQIGGFRTGLDGSQDYDLALRAVARSMPERIVHIPKVLYHWRQRGATLSFSEKRLSMCAANGRRAVMAFVGGTAQVQPAPAVPAWNRVVYPVPEPEPLVSVIIPTRDHAGMLATATAGLLERTDYRALELLIADNGSEEQDALALLDRLAADPRVRVLRRPGPFNYAALNNAAVREATGELILLLNNDIDVIHGDWLREMVSHALRPEIGAVGAKLLYPDGSIQHGGVTVGMFGVAGHQYLKRPQADPGYFGHLQLVRSVTAVTGACLLVRRAAFQAVGGFDEVSLPVAFNDVDLCLKLMQHGYRNLWTPYATLYHRESASRGSDQVPEKAERFQRETETMRQRWGDRLRHDPYWNPNLSLHSSEIALAFPPREPVLAG